VSFGDKSLGDKRPRTRGVARARRRTHGRTVAEVATHSDSEGCDGHDATSAVNMATICSSNPSESKGVDGHRAAEPIPDGVRQRVRLTRADDAAIMRRHLSGESNVSIASRFGISAAAVGQCIRELSPSVDWAKLYLASKADVLAKKVVTKSRASDAIRALKGLGVLGEDRAPGVTVYVGGTGEIAVGVRVGHRDGAVSVSDVSPHTS